MRRTIILACVLLVVLLAGGMAFGSLRWGGVEGLYRRVHAEVAAWQPHPLLAPTPLPTSDRASQGMASPPQASRAPAVRSIPATAQPASTAVPPTAPALTPTPFRTRPSATIPDGATPESLRPPRETAQVLQPALQPPPSVQLDGLTHIWQTWNNCGPATLSMNLSYFGLRTPQAEVAASLRPNKEDKNVSPDELAAFARGQSLSALARVNGDAGRLRQLLAIGVPVLVETWHEPKPNDGMGHYRLLVGYDDANQTWIAYDSYDAKGVDPNKAYAGIRIPYAELDPLWKVFNRQYVILYNQGLADRVQTILGDDLDDAEMWRRAGEYARAAVEQDPADAFAWFNLGSALTALGRYEEAAHAYDTARQIGLPWRMFWYQFGPFQAYYEAGRYEEVVALANTTLRTAKYVEELYYWRGLAEQAQGKTAEARRSFQQALEMNKNYAPAAEALADLPAP